MTPVLATMTNLRNLDLSCNGEAIDDTDCVQLKPALSQMKKLQRLMLHDNDIGNNGVVALKDSLKLATELREVNLDRNPIGDEGASGMAELIQAVPSIRHVGIHETQMTCVGAEALIRALSDTDPMRCNTLKKLCRFIITAAMMQQGLF